MRRLRDLFRPSAYKVGLAVGALFIVVHVWVLSHAFPERVPLLGRIEGIFHDLKFQERGPREPSGDVVIGAIDEAAIREVGRWPFNRADVAQLIEKLSALGARVILFDMVFADKVTDDTSGILQKVREEFGAVSLASPAGEAIRGALGATPDESTRESFERLRTQQVDFARMLTRLGGKHPDHLLAEAAQQTPGVVLGAFLDTKEVAQGQPDELRRVARRTVAHVRLTNPFLPTDIAAGNETQLMRLRPAPPPSLPAMPAIVAPLELLVRRPDGSSVDVGFFNTAPDPDGVIRRTPIVLNAGEDPDARPDANAPPQLLLYPSLEASGILAFQRVNRAEGVWVFSAADDAGRLDSLAYLPDSAGKTVEAPLVSSLRHVPLDAGGRLLLNYYGPDRTIPNVSLADVATGRATKAQFDGKLVIVGVTATGTFDQRVTPFNQISPGVETHATALENMLHGDYLMRPWWAIWMELLILLAIALIVGRLFSKVSVLTGLPLMAATAAIWHLIDLRLFSNGIAVFSFLPIGEVVSIYGLQTIYRYVTEEREKQQIRRAFQFYLTKSVMEEMLQDPGKLKLGGDKRVLTVMFSDIRGFTTISERLTPEQLAKMINEYLTPMTGLVFETGGTLDKYIGDALMAVWGAPVAQPDHALRACKTAVAMVRALGDLQRRWDAEGRGYPPIDIGIGLNSGPMVVGNMGADQRFDYTVLGDNVNLASRLEGTNKDYRSRIIISQATLELSGGQLAVRQLGAVRVKGKSEPVRIYELLDDKPAEGELAEVIRLFDAGVDAFRSQRWQAAREAFRAVLARRPTDGPSHAYLEFVDEYEKDPPGDGWDGVYTMTHK